MAGRTSLLPYTSCTFKITIAPRRILHISIHSFRTIFHNIQEELYGFCHHLLSWAYVLQRWVVLGHFHFEFFFISCCSSCFHICLAVFNFLLWFGVLFGNSNRCTLFNWSWAILVQFLVGFYTPLSCCFYFRYLILYCNFIWFILCSLSLLISESICVLSSHVFPKCHQIISSTLFGLFVSWFWSKYLIWICSVFDLLVPFIFSFSSYLCLDLHKYLFINSIVFVFWYLAVFSSFYRIPCFT